MKRPFLTGPRVYLRPLEESDIGEDYLGWLNDREVTQFLGVGKFPSTAASVRRYLERFADSSTDLILAIVDRESGLHIGNVTLNHINWIDRSADTGLMIGRRDFWGRGYAFEAWSLIIEHAFLRLGLHRLTAGAVAAHERSQETLRKLGFREEGVQREAAFVDGKFCDVIRLGLLRDEFSWFEGGAGR